MANRYWSLTLALVLFLVAGGSARAVDDSDVASLAKGLEAKEPAARVKAAESLAKLGVKAKPALPALSKACADETKEVRIAALEAVEAIDPELGKHVRVLVLDTNRSKHVDTSKAIKRLGTRATVLVPLILRQLHIGTDFFNKPKHVILPFAAPDTVWFGEHIDTLVSLSPDEDTLALLSRWAKTTVGGSRLDITVGFHRLAYKQLAVLGKVNPKLCPAIVPVLVEGLNDPLDRVGKTEFREASIEALRSLGSHSRDAVPALKKLKGDSSERVRTAAEAAIKDIER